MQRAACSQLRHLSLWLAGGVTRSCASAAGGLDRLDKIQLKGLCFHGYHGVYEEEAKLGQKFLVDATLFCDLRRAGGSDDLAHTINYAEVYECIKHIMEGPPHKLLESAAERISRSILAADERIAGVQLQLRKPHVAVTGVLESLGIETLRRRGDYL